jgi:small-conductance mechanosensitive channel
MKTVSHNPFIQYAFVACLGMLLILGQTFKLHMHVTSLEVKPTHVFTEQIGQIHIASMLHDKANKADLQSGNQTHKHSAEIEISSDSYVKKTELLVLAVLLILVAALVLSGLHSYRVIRYFSNPRRLVVSLLYLISPPLRAPPATQLI